MRFPRQSTTVFCGAMLAVASVGGLGLAHYSEGGAFSFYKQQPKFWPETPQSQSAEVGWTYPVDMRPTRQPEPTPIDAIYAEDSGPPALDTPLPSAQAYSPDVVEDGPEVAEDAAVVQVAHGSWSQPQARETQPAAEIPQETAEASPIAGAPPAEAEPES